MKGKLLLLTCTISIILASLFAANVLAITGTIGNARMVLYPTVGSITGASIERTILVRNVNDEQIHIQMTVPSENPNKIDLKDKDFVLASGEAKNTTIVIHVKNAGDFEDKVNVFFSPMEKGPGVVLSSVIIIHAEKKGWFGNADGGNNQDVENTTITQDGNISINANNSTIDNSDKKSGSGIFILGISTIVLLVILVLILVILKRKKEPKLEKRRVRSS